MKDNKKITVSKNIGVIEESLSEDAFFRIHHSTLINLYMVKNYSRSDYSRVEMMNGAVLDISTRKTKEFRDIFQKM